MLKIRYNESAEHFFVVKAIEEELKKYYCEIELFETRGPDIVFDCYGKKIAIEVETGKKLRKNNVKLERKVYFLKKKFKNNWFFVVTDWRNKRIYMKYGKTYVRNEIPRLLYKKYFNLGPDFDLS